MKRKLSCNFCHKKYHYSNCLYRHEKTCKANPNRQPNVRVAPSSIDVDEGTTHAQAVIPSLSRIYDHGVVTQINKAFEMFVIDARTRLNELLEEIFG